MLRGASVLALFLAAVVQSAHVDDWQVINSINSDKLTWRAGPNPVGMAGPDSWKFLLGARQDPDLAKRPRYTPPITNAEIPESFDSRQQWSQCSSIASIKDQAQCGSCWAVSSSAAMSDRLCIATQGNTKVDLSPEYLMTCCYSCGEGCNGGYPNEAWNWFQSNGLVTGGGYQSNEGCQPYVVGPSWPGNTPDCVADRCTNTDYQTPFNQDKHYGSSSFYLSQDVAAIQREIMTNGPVVAAFAVYSDFMSYQSGVYQHVTGGLEGYHAVRVIGWGVENGVDYWLVTNSWNTYWGESGLFKIRRGNNECGFEEQMTAGHAKA